MKTRLRLLFGPPLLLVLLLLGVILALPSFVSSSAHRATIEALASSLTGRQVHIGGRLSLALLPAPQLIAEQITISGPAASPAGNSPAGASITARSLTLNIALGPLLQGRLSASSLTLQSPTIIIPWPLPGGDIATGRPGWLAALHAQINNGRVSVGAVQLTHVNADLFTGGGGAVSVSGSFLAGGRALDLSLGLGAAGATGAAPLTIDLTASDASKLSAHFSGNLNGAGELTGGLSAAMAAPGGGPLITASATIVAAGAGAGSDNLTLQQGPARLAGSATLSFAPALLSMTLTGAHLALPAWPPLPGNGAAMPLRLTLDATDCSLAGAAIARLHLTLAEDAGGTRITGLTATLPGAAKLAGSGAIDPAGAITGQLEFDAGDLAALLAADGAANLPDGWRRAHFTAAVQGDRYHLAVSRLQGFIGPSQVSGGAIFTRPGGRVTAAGQLHFDQLDLTPVARLRGLPAGDSGFSVQGEITADRASFQTVKLTHVLLDAAWDKQLTVRRFSASLYGGLAAASFSFTPGRSIAARGLLNLPAAMPLAAMLPAAWPMPRLLSHAPLAVSLLAQGPAAALATSLTASLGDLAVTAAPLVNLPGLTAAGPFTLRYPNAIAWFAAFGLNAGLAWPGAGSIALRASLAVAPGRIGLPDFVLSMGELTANGTLSLGTDGKIAADIDADTLALPPLPPRGFGIPWGQLSGASGLLTLRANRVLLGGRGVLGPATASLTLAPGAAALAVPHAALAGGDFSGSLTALTAGGRPPALTANFRLTGGDAAAISPPFSFPLTLPAGRVNLQAALTANGYAPGAWAATLAGEAAMTAANGTLSGFNLAGMAAALKTPRRAAPLRAALLGGATNYASLAVSGSFDHGNYSIGKAALLGPDGGAGATGGIDLPDRAVALTFSFAPNAAPPLTIGLSTIGGWTAPKQIPALAAALTWKPTS